jgi:predicted nucleic acid-binding protein
MNAVIDSNILIDNLNGVAAARTEIARYGTATISVVTWIEVMAGAADEGEAQRLRAFLATFALQELTQEIADRAATIRRTSGLRLPDAIIRATADALGQLLVTRNTRDFDARDPAIRIPYRL